MRIDPQSELDEVPLMKFEAGERIRKLLSVCKQPSCDKTLVKTASLSADASALVELFTKMLATLNLKAGAGTEQEVLDKLSSSSGGIKTSAVTKAGGERREEIKIASKKIKDSHYHVDVSKDAITRDGKKVYMVSCYARDAYLGRYVIKRNYFFTMDRESAANAAYDEIVTKVGAVKERYYNEVIESPAITTQLRTILDGVVSEIKIEEDTMSTTVNRLPPN